MNKSTQSKLFQQLNDKQIFEQAKGYAYAYADQALERNVFPDDKAIERLAEFEEALPDNPAEAEQVLSMLHELGSPATVAQTGGRYFGFVNGSAIPTSLAARWLADFWDQNTLLHVGSPIASKLESVTEQWLRQLFGLPDNVVAGFLSGSSMAIFCGLAAARYRIFQNENWDFNKNGFYGAPEVRIVAGRQAHGTVLKAVALLGFGTDTIEWVDADAQGRIIAEQVPELDDRTILILQAGNVNSGAFDDFAYLCKKANEAGAWVHIDGAFGLWAACAAKLKYLTNGIEHAQSFSIDAHKTLNVPYDNGIILCSDREALTGALQVSDAYIAYGENRDGMLYTPEMSRRARVVELWAALKYLGRSGVDDLVYGLHSRAVQFSEELRAEGFKVLNDVVYNQVLVGFDNDVVTSQVIEQIQSSGECWVGPGSWNGQAVIRISVCSWATTAEDISRSVRAFVSAGEAVAGCSSGPGQ